MTTNQISLRFLMHRHFQTLTLHTSCECDHLQMEKHEAYGGYTEVLEGWRSNFEPLSVFQLSH